MCLKVFFPECFNFARNLFKNVLVFRAHVIYAISDLYLICYAIGYFTLGTTKTLLTSWVLVTLNSIVHFDVSTGNIPRRVFPL